MRISTHDPSLTCNCSYHIIKQHSNREMLLVCCSPMLLQRGETYHRGMLLVCCSTKLLPRWKILPEREQPFNKTAQQCSKQTNRIDDPCFSCSLLPADVRTSLQFRWKNISSACWYSFRRKKSIHIRIECWHQSCLQQKANQLGTPSRSYHKYFDIC